MAVEDELQDAAHVPHLVSRERRLPVDVRVASCLEQPVALAQRHLEGLGEREQRLAAWLRAAGLDEADMPARKTGPHRQIELAQPARRPPFAQQVSDGTALLNFTSPHHAMLPA